MKIVLFVILSLFFVVFLANDIILFVRDRFFHYEFHVSKETLSKIYADGKVQTGKWIYLEKITEPNQGKNPFYHFMFRDGTKISCPSQLTTFYILSALEAFESSSATDESTLQRAYSSIKKNLTNVLMETRNAAIHVYVALAIWAVLALFTLAGLFYFIENEYNQMFGVTINPELMTIIAFLLIIFMAIYPWWCARKVGRLSSEFPSRQEQILPSSVKYFEPIPKIVGESNVMGEENIRKGEENIYVSIENRIRPKRLAYATITIFILFVLLVLIATETINLNRTEQTVQNISSVKKTIVVIFISILIIATLVAEISLYIREQFFHSEFHISKDALSKTYADGKVQTGKWECLEKMVCRFLASGTIFKFVFRDGTKITCPSPVTTLHILSALESMEGTNPVGYLRTESEYSSTKEKQNKLRIEIYNAQWKATLVLGICNAIVWLSLYALIYIC